MNDIETWEVAGHCLEYMDDIHQYLVDGVMVPSITQVLKHKFGGKYEGISKATLNNASRLGTAVHQAIEQMCKEGVEAELPEIRNFKFLQKQYGFKVLENEVPVILFMDEVPVSAGRLDLVLEMRMTADNGNTAWNAIGLGDIKRTSTLDKEYLGFQLNLYRIAFMQCYDKKIEFLRGVHLKDDTRKFVQIPINEEMAWKLVKDYMESKDA